MRQAESQEAAILIPQPASPLSSRTERLLERRWEPRYTTNDPATVKVLPAGRVQIPGVVLDISRFGIGIELPVSLEKGVEVKITMPFGVVLLGKVRYCVTRDSGFHIGIATREVIYDREEPELHLHDDVLGLFACGHGLTAPEVIKLKDHLIRCEECRIRLADAPISRPA